MGFARLVVASVLYPTLVAVLILTGLVAYATIFAGRDSAPHHWNANKHVHTDGLTFVPLPPPPKHLFPSFLRT
jgi:hypothetical protein